MYWFEFDSTKNHNNLLKICLNIYKTGTQEAFKNSFS